MGYTHVRIKKTYKSIVNIEVNKSLVCFCYVTDYDDPAIIQAALYGINSSFADVYLQAMKKSLPDYKFDIYFDLREYYIIHETLKGVFFSVYGIYVDSSTKLWGVGSEEQDSFIEDVLESMYPFLPKGSYTRALSLQPATYSSLINIITNYSLIRN